MTLGTGFTNEFVMNNDIFYRPTEKSPGEEFKFSTTLAKMKSKGSKTRLPTPKRWRRKIEASNWGLAISFFIPFLWAKLAPTVIGTLLWHVLWPF